LPKRDDRLAADHGRNQHRGGTSPKRIAGRWTLRQTGHLETVNRPGWLLTGLEFRPIENNQGATGPAAVLGSSSSRDGGRGAASVHDVDRFLALAGLGTNGRGTGSRSVQDGRAS